MERDVGLLATQALSLSIDEGTLDVAADPIEAHRDIPATQDAESAPNKLTPT